MRRRGWLRLAVASVAASSIEWGLGCGEVPTSTGGGAPPIDDLLDVVYEGGATDEALRAMLAESLVTSSSEGASMLTPPPSSSLTSASAPTFVWAVGAKTAVGEAPRAVDPARRAPPRRGIALRLGPRAALAHGTPISGRAYFVVFTSLRGERLARVFTTSLEHTPSENVWGRIAAAGAFFVVVTNALFEENRVAADGGPYRGPPSAFRIG